MAEETIVAICQYGGKFNSEVDGTKYYTGGEAHAVDINRKMTLHEFKSEISDMFKIDISTISLKYFRNKRALITVRSDKDLEKMVDLNIASGTVDIYILSEADNRTKAADSGAVVAETAAIVHSQRSPDTGKISKRETSSTVSPSIETIKPGDGGAGAEHKTRKTRKRLPKSSVSPSVEAMNPVEVGAGANAGPSTGKTRKRLPKSSVSPAVEAMNPVEVGAVANAGVSPSVEAMNAVEVGAGANAGQSTGKTRKRLPKSSVLPSVEVMNPVEVGADANAGQSTGKTRKRLPKSSISPSVEAMIPVEVGADANSGQSTEKSRKRVTRSSVSASVDAMKPANEGVGAEAGQSSRKTSERVIRSTASPSFEATRHGDGGDNDDARQIKAAKLIRDAGNLLGTENLAGSKKLVLEALEYDPLVEGADQVIAVADVLLAAQHRINNQIDWYAVLQLDPATSGNNDDELRLHYRRLTLLLRTSSLPHAADALRIVADAYDVLSDSSKKYLFDAWSELTIASADLRSGSAPLEPPGHPAAAAAAAADQPFWTTCPSCFHVYQYDRAHEGRCLLCQNCRRAFLATALTAAPSIVPGTEMYYCSWGCFPIGFSNGVNSGYTSMPRSQSPTNVGHLGGSLPQIGGYKGDILGSQRTASPKKPPLTRKRKVTSPDKPLPDKKRKTASPNNPPPARKRKVAAKKIMENNSKESVLVENNSKERVLVGEPEARACEANVSVVEAEGKSDKVNVLVVEAEAKIDEANVLAVEAEAKTGEANTLVVDAEAKSEDANVLIVETDAMNDMFGVEVEDKSEEANMLVVGADDKNEEANVLVVEAEANGEEAKEFVVDAEVMSEEARPIGGGPEESDGAAAGKKAAPVVLDLNEEAGFLETHDTGLMMDHYDDIVGFDLDLDAVDLDAAGDLLGNLNLSNGFHVQHHP